MDNAQDYATVSGTKVKREDFAYAPPDSKPSEWKLPIHDAAHVRNALARYNQSDLPAGAKEGVWRKILGAAKKFGIEVSDKSRSLAGARDDSVGLSEVRDGLVRIALAYTNSPGTKFEQAGQKFTITEQDLEDMKRNLAEREVPIDYDHLSAAAHQLPPGFAKAAGWLVKPDTIEDFTESRKILWAWARFTPTMLAMIKQREYRYGSIDFRWKDKNELGENVGTYLHAFAMTNRPFLKDLPPTEISDADYQSLFGLAARQDGKLAAITLSEDGRLTSPEAVHVPSIIGGKQTGGNQMKKQAFISKSKTKPGKFAVRYDDDTTMDDLDDITMEDLDDLLAAKGYKKADDITMEDMDDLLAAKGFKRVKADDDSTADDDATMAKKASELRAARQVIATFKEAGCENMQLVEVKQLIEKGRAAAAAPAKTEAQLLAECVAENGTMKLAELDRLADDAKIKPSAFRRALEAEAKVTKAFTEGRIKPTQRAKALALCLANEPAFDEFIAQAKPLVDISVRGASAPAEGSAVAGMQLDALVQERMKAHPQESVDQALTAVTATPEGKALWEQKRLEEIEAGKK